MHIFNETRPTVLSETWAIYTLLEHSFIIIGSEMCTFASRQKEINLTYLSRDLMRYILKHVHGTFEVTEEMNCLQLKCTFANVLNFLHRLTVPWWVITSSHLIISQTRTVLIKCVCRYAIYIYIYIYSLSCHIHISATLYYHLGSVPFLKDDLMRRMMNLCTLRYRGTYTCATHLSCFVFKVC